MTRKDAAAQYPIGPATRYGLALLAAVFSVALRVWLMRLLGDRTSYLASFAVLIFATLYLGLGTAILTATVSMFGIWFWILAPNHSPLDRSEVFGAVAFLILSGVIIAFGEATRRSKIEQATTEHALRESEARLTLALEGTQGEIERRTFEIEQKTVQMVEQARFLDLANDAIFVRTARGRIEYWNQGAERLYGWTKEEALGRLTHELLRTRFPSSLPDVQETERWEGELVQVKRGGSEIIVASRWATVRDRDGNFSGWLEINTDITARRRAEDAARRLSGRILSLQDDERRRI